MRDRTKERLMRGLIMRLAMDSYYGSTNRTIVLEHLGIEDDGDRLTNENEKSAALDRMFGKIDDDDPPPRRMGESRGGPLFPNGD